MSRGVGQRLTLAEEVIELPPRLPAIALRDLVFFPCMTATLLMGRRRTLAALEEASGAKGSASGLVLLATQRDALAKDPGISDLYGIGTIARVVDGESLADGTRRTTFIGLGRAKITRLVTTTEALRARFELVSEIEREERGPTPEDVRETALKVATLYLDYARLHDAIPEGGFGELGNGGVRRMADEGDRVRMSYLVASHLVLPASEKQELLGLAELLPRLQLLSTLLARELKALEVEAMLDKHLRGRLNLIGGATPPRLDLPGQWGGPGDYREQGDAGADKAGTGQRGAAAPGREDVREIRVALEGAQLPRHALDRAERELRQLSILNPVSPEAAVVRTYLDWMVSIPWSRRDVGEPSVSRVAQVLDEGHFGLDDVKERIVDHVAVLSLVGKVRGTILCVVGPPGVGKTSLARSIAKALGREFVRASLGGIRDEAEIRGHRRTYVGALPGRVLQAMRRAGTVNPVFLLDEVDKMSRDFHGDPGAALLEVLDPEHNRTFTDHYLELEYDLSDVFFVTTANTLQDIPGPLRDRMEVIRLPGYLDTEKREIASRFLWPKLVRRHGIGRAGVGLTRAAVDRVVARYTREAGVRELDRQLARVARKLARSVAEEGKLPEQVDAADLRALLGPPPYSPPSLDDDDERVGIANGLAWTPVGGAMLDVEVAVVPGDGKLRLTGTLGEVMRESAQAAVTYARSRAEVLGLDPHFSDRVDVHVHIPEGATPKDGPSAGITIAVALVSALTDTPTRKDVATTGEITLRGRVLPVGGIKEKAVAAMRGGLSTVVLPLANSPDLELLPAEVRESVYFELVRNMDEVMGAVLVGWVSEGATRASEPPILSA